MNVTKKTRLLAAVPIAQTSDGVAKVYSLKEDGQAATFRLGHDWIARTAGIFDSPVPEGKYGISGAFLMYDGIDEHKLTVDYGAASGSGSDYSKLRLHGEVGGGISTGTYPDAKLLICVEGNDNFEDLVIPVNLIVE